MTDLLTITQVRRRLKKSRDFVESIIASGALAAVDLTAAGKRRDIRVTTEALASYLASVAVVARIPEQRGRSSRKRQVVGDWF